MIHQAHIYLGIHIAKCLPLFGSANLLCLQLLGWTFSQKNELKNRKTEKGQRLKQAAEIVYYTYMSGLYKLK